MDDHMPFIVTGSPQIVSRAIEECARGVGNVTAIVVPWESDNDVLNMAVTSVRADGWAIEHTNLGTIRLSGAGQDRTEVAFTAEPPEHPDQQRLVTVFDRFVRQVQDKFRAKP
jgi:hypothetical protein